MSCCGGLADLWKRHAWFRIATLVLGCSILYSVTWMLFFVIRVLVVMEKNRDEYSEQEYQHRLCESNESTREGFSKACDEAKKRVSTTLWRESTYKTWETSTLCGGASCFVMVFGADETVTMLVLRTTALLCVVTALLYCTYVVVRKFNAWFGDREMERERTYQKHNDFIQRKRRSQNDTTLALSNQAYSTLPMVRNRSSALVVESVPDDA